MSSGLNKEYCIGAAIGLSIGMAVPYLFSDAYDATATYAGGIVVFAALLLLAYFLTKRSSGKGARAVIIFAVPAAAVLMATAGLLRGWDVLLLVPVVTVGILCVCSYLILRRADSIQTRSSES